MGCADVFQSISVLVPTRRRPEALSRLLASFAATVPDPCQAELVFRCDSDDPESMELVRRSGCLLVVGPRNEGYRSLPLFFNQMAAVARGDVLMCCNDDAEFQTPGWPALILAEANNYPDGIFNIGVRVGLNDDKFPFSVVSRRMMDRMGCLNDPRLLFSDVFLLDVARAFNRAVRLDSVTVFHHWAGHRADDTRLEANRHEFELVFKDVHGNWTDAYRDLHTSVVAEAVGRIRADDEGVADTALAQLERYRPPAASPLLWPPAVSCASWNGRHPPDTIHYSRSEVRQVIAAMVRHGVVGSDIVVTSFNNGLPSLLWGQLFDRVVTVAGCEQLPERRIDDGRHTVLAGSTGDPAFMSAVIAELAALRAVVIDDTRYASIISPYFRLRPLVRRPGIVVFTNTGPSQPAAIGARRFVAELRRGAVDNCAHEIYEVLPDPQGPGMSYELLL
jgi:hypothetical protein